MKEKVENKINSISSSTLVIIVTFNPEIKLLKKNLSAIADQFDNILIIDNDSDNLSSIISLTKGFKKPITIKELSENYGIAYAQNIGLKAALENKYKWLLTMDQDSIIPKNLSKEYNKIIAKFDKIGLIGWNQKKSEQDAEIIKDDWWIVSSGCLISVSALNRVNGFDETFFIDHVDTDINVKLKNLGLRLLTTNKVNLVHQLGAKTNQRTLRGDYYHSHSPDRVYYIIRNGIVIFKRYFFKHPVWMLQALKTCFREGIYLLYFQPQKKQNFLIIAKAWQDGFLNRLGKLKKTKRVANNY